MHEMGRFAPPEPARVGIVRGFPQVYEMDEWTGHTPSTVPHGRWWRGELVRASQPAMSLAPLVNQYDPTNPASWVRETS